VVYLLRSRTCGMRLRLRALSRLVALWNKSELRGIYTGSYLTRCNPAQPNCPALVQRITVSNTTNGTEVSEVSEAQIITK